MKMKIPTAGEQYRFFDDGKIRWEDTPVSLYTIWREEIDRHRQGNTFKVLTSSSMEFGVPWLYAEKTDYLIKCSIPNYDENDIEFEWQSMQV